MKREYSSTNGSSLGHRTAWAVYLMLIMSACSTEPSRGVYHEERFESTETHARSFDAPTSQTCEAARRTLLSQGYSIVRARSDQVTARKSFQPQADVHMEIEFHVACVSDGRTGRSAIAFANAVQERYSLKKVNNSASIGVGALGSLSVPLMSSDEALVKVASETISSGGFYERFFVLLERYLSDADPEMGYPPSDGQPSVSSATAQPEP